jgi:5-methylcytosine-specific restriction endonuclease McrA
VTRKYLNYLEYLDSPEWWTKRRAAMRRAQWRCEYEKPGDPRHEGPLEVHHRHYRTLGCEGLDDLEVLCPACHRAKRIPRNLQKRALESYGQERLFQRWGHDYADDETNEAA